MSFEEFIARVLEKFCSGVENAEDKVRVRNDRENGRYFAYLPDESTVIARPGSLKVTVRFGSDHQIMTELG